MPAWQRGSLDIGAAFAPFDQDIEMPGHREAAPAADHTIYGHIIADFDLPEIEHPSNMAPSHSLQDHGFNGPNAILVAFIKGPLLDAFCAHQTNLRQHLHVLA